jgi:hypothetical protein
VTINILPDDVLLHIFHFDRLDGHLSSLPLSMWRHPGRWHRLVHVCRRWRTVVFMSPNFLDLRLVCYPRTRLELLRIWPPLPIVIRNMVHTPHLEDYDSDAALAIVDRNRVCEIYLNITSPQLQRLASTMQERFPALTCLKLVFCGYFSFIHTGRRLLSWNCPTSAISRIAFYCIPCASETSFVRNRPCPHRPPENSPFWVLLTRGDRHWPGRAGQPQISQH